MSWHAGQRCGPFQLQARIGQGGMGEVWRAVHVGDGKSVAVKRLVGGATPHSTRARRAFQDEVRAVATLCHPHVIRVHDQGVDDGDPWLVMDLADGALSDLRYPTRWSDLREALEHTLRGLAHAHARGILHRDVKPANVLRVGALWQISDFGIARALDRGVIRSRASGGTPAYMAPEQVRGHWRDQGPATDLYALGCMAFELVCGRLPFNGATTEAICQQHLNQPMPELTPIVAIPAGVHDWIARLLQKAAIDRYQTAADALHGLEGVGGPLLEPRAPGERTTHQTWFDVTVLTEAIDDAPVVAARPPPPAGPPPIPDTWRQAERQTSRLDGVGLGLYGLRALPMVGRRRERDALWNELRSVHHNGRCRVVVLQGPAGVGKSQLAEWLCVQAAEVGAAIPLRCTHQPIPGPMDGPGRMLAYHLGNVGLSPKEVRARTHRLLRERGATDPWEGLALSELQAPTGELRLSPDERCAVIERLITRCDRPVVVWLDDVQWGAESVELAAWLRDRPVPALVMCTARTEDLQPGVLEPLRDATRVEVQPLSPVDHRALVRELLGLEPGLAAQVEARTAGNPLFAVQLVGDWVERRVLQPIEGGFRLRPGARAELPDGLHAVWAQQIAHLVGADDGRMLEVAAALGQAVDEEQLTAACEEAGVPCRPALVGALLDRRLALRRPGGWSFVHGMLRESLERQAREAGRWAGYHDACARVIREDPGRSGRHLLEAGRAADAIRPLQDGCYAADVRGETGLALSLARDWEAALRRAGVPRSDPRWAACWTEQGNLLRQRVEMDAASAILGRVVAGAAPGWSADVEAAHLMLAVVKMHQGEREEALAHQQEAARLARAGGRVVEAAKAEGIRCQLLQITGEAAEAARAGQAAVDALRQCPGSEHELADTLNHAADAWRLVGRLDLAEAAYEEALPLHRAAGYQQAQARSLCGLSELRRIRGDLDRAREGFQRAKLIYQRTGNTAGLSDAISHLAEVDRARGDLDAAERGYRESLHLSLTHGMMDAPVAQANLGLVLLARERFEEARSVLEAAAAEMESRDRTGWAGAMLAVTLPCVVGTDAWAARHQRVVALLNETGVADPDVAWGVRLAARRAAELGLHGVARQCWALVASQCRALGDEAGAADAERMLD